jgi:ParB/RepB/Spo0J family partition protein
MSTSTVTIQLIPVTELRASPMNPRKRYDEAGLDELANSIRELGVLQPLVARQTADVYELACGHRRWMAAQRAGLEAVPVQVRELSDVELRLVLLTENGQRADVHPLDESDALRALLDAGLTVGQLADRLGRPVPFLRRRLLLQALTPESRACYLAGRLELGHAQLLATLGPADQAEAVQVSWLFESQGDAESSTPRAKPIREWVTWMRKVDRKLAKAPWDLADATLVKVAGACAVCPKRSGAQAELLPELAGDDTCGDATCWDRKTDAIADRQLVALKRAHPRVLQILSPASQNKRSADVVRAYSAVQTFGTDGWYPAKAEAPGAVPAVVRVGDRAGTVQWLTRTKPPERKPSSGGAKSDPNAARRNKALQDALAQARKLLAAKIPLDLTKGTTSLALVREALANGEFYGAIKKMQKAKDVASLLHVVVADFLEHLGDDWGSRTFSAKDQQEVFDTAKLLKVDLAPVVKAYEAAIAPPAAKPAATTATKPGAPAVKAKGSAPKKKAAPKKTPGPARAAYLQPMVPSAQLAVIVGAAPLARTEVTKMLWAYITKHKLQDKQNKRVIRADDALRPIFGADAINMFDMTKRVNAHLTVAA